MSAPHKVTSYSFSDEERAIRLWSVVEDHKPASEVVALNHGSYILAAPTVISSLYSQRFFNKRYKIGGKNLFMYVPMLVPALGTALVHRKLIENQLLFENMTCEGCLIFQSAAMHVCAGVVWSFFMSSISGTMVASLKKTVYVPPIDKYPLQTLQHVGKQFKKFIPAAIAICVGNFAFALVLTNLEIEQFKNMKNRMLARLNSVDFDVSPSEFDNSRS